HLHRLRSEPVVERRRAGEGCAAPAVRARRPPEDALRRRQPRRPGRDGAVVLPADAGGDPRDDLSPGGAGRAAPPVQAVKASTGGGVTLMAALFFVALAHGAAAGY